MIYSMQAGAGNVELLEAFGQYLSDITFPRAVAATAGGALRIARPGACRGPGAARQASSCRVCRGV